MAKYGAPEMWIEVWSFSHRVGAGSSEAEGRLTSGITAREEGCGSKGVYGGGADAGTPRREAILAMAAGLLKRV